jgi:hypothetical protein
MENATGPVKNGSDEEFMRVYGKLDSPQYFKTEEITSSEAASQGT